MSRVPRHDDSTHFCATFVTAVPRHPCDILRQTLCRQAHRTGIKPVRSRSHPPADAARSEGEDRTESVLEFFGAACVDEGMDFIPVRREVGFRQPLNQDIPRSP